MNRIRSSILTLTVLTLSVLPMIGCSSKLKEPFIQSSLDHEKSEPLRIEGGNFLELGDLLEKVAKEQNLDLAGYSCEEETCLITLIGLGQKATFLHGGEALSFDPVSRQALYAPKREAVALIQRKFLVKIIQGKEAVEVKFLGIPSWNSVDSCPKVMKRDFLDCTPYLFKTLPDKNLVQSAMEQFQVDLSGKLEHEAVARLMQGLQERLSKGGGSAGAFTVPTNFPLP